MRAARELERELDVPMWQIVALMLPPTVFFGAAGAVLLWVSLFAEAAE